MMGNIVGLASSLLWRGELEAAGPRRRSHERDRKVALSAVASIAARAVSVAVALITVPLTIRYLGVERYGMWMTLSSLVALAGFTDLGIGNGLVTIVARAHGRDDHEEIRRHVATAVIVLAAICVVLGIAFAVAFNVISWPRVFNVRGPVAAAEAAGAVLALFGCFLFATPLSVVPRMQTGLQDGFIVSLFAALGSLLSLAGVLLAIRAGAGLPLLVLAFAGAPILGTLLSGWYLFVRQCPWARPTWRDVDRTAAKRLLHTGVLYFVLQAAAAIAFQSDNIIAAHTLGSGAVAEYSVAMRLFALAPSLLLTFVAPLWPAYGEAIARGDVQWVKSRLVRSLQITLSLSSAAALILVFLGKRIIGIWAGPAVIPPTSLLVGLGMWSVLTTCGSTVTAFLNGAQVVRFQVIAATLMTTASLALKLVLAPRFGTTGIIWGTVLAYTLFTAIPCLVFVPRVLGRVNRSAIVVDGASPSLCR